MSLELWQDPRVPLQFQVETGLLLRGNGDIGIPFQTKQGNRPSSRVEEGKTGLFLSCGRTQHSFRVGTGIEGSFWGFIKGVKFPFEFQEGTWDFMGNAAA